MWKWFYAPYPGLSWNKLWALSIENPIDYTPLQEKLREVQSERATTFLGINIYHIWTNTNYLLHLEMLEF